MERKIKKAVSIAAGFVLLTSMCLSAPIQSARAGSEPEEGDRRLLARVAGDTHCHSGTNVKTLSPLEYGVTWQNNHPATFKMHDSMDIRIEDVTGYDTIELDMYIADEANRAAYYDWKDQMTILLFGNRIGSNDELIVPYPPPEEVKVGSNLVELDLYIAASQGMDLSRIYAVSFKTHPNNAFDYNFGHGWQGTSNDGLKTARSFTFTYQNIYAVKTGRWADGLFHGGNYHFVHTAATTTDYASIHQSMAAPKDASSGDYIQFDFYVSDLEALKAIKTTGGNSAFGMFIIRLRTTDPGKGEADGNWYSADFASQVVRSGHNTVLLRKTDFGVFGSANWNRIAKIEFYSEPFMTPASFPKLFTLGLTNFRTLDATPPGIGSGTLVHGGDIAKIMEPEHLQSVYSYNWINSYVGFDKVWDLTKYDYFEFDFYISDAQTFKSEVNYYGQLFRFITAANAETGELYRFGPWMMGPDFKDQITRSGWNHIVIPVSALSGAGGGNPPGAGDPSTARGIEFWAEGNTLKTHLQRYVTRYANLVLSEDIENNKVVDGWRSSDDSEDASAAGVKPGGAYIGYKAWELNVPAGENMLYDTKITDLASAVFRVEPEDLDKEGMRLDLSFTGNKALVNPVIPGSDIKKFTLLFTGDQVDILFHTGTVVPGMPGASPAIAQLSRSAVKQDGAVILSLSQQGEHYYLSVNGTLMKPDNALEPYLRMDAFVGSGAWFRLANAGDAALNLVGIKSGDAAPDRYGDIDADGDVDENDLAMIGDFLLKRDTGALSPAQLLAAKVTGGEGAPDILDLLEIKRFISKQSD